jgi:hypothetical protein
MPAKPDIQVIKEMRPGSIHRTASRPKNSYLKSKSSKQNLKAQHSKLKTR